MDSSITTGISMDVDLYNEMEKYRNESGDSRSYFIQSAIRIKIKTIKKQNISDFLSSLNNDELTLLKNELIHR